MIPLISKSTFDNLKARRHHILGQPAYVFLPVAQDNPQILFIGHASRGEVCDGTYIDVAHTIYSWLEKSLITPRTSGFWQAIRSIVDQCTRIVSPNSGRLPVGWSNLCKIGDCNG